MNAYPQALSRALDMFLVFEVEDPLHSSLCKGWAEAAMTIANFPNLKSVRVWRVTLDELARDVTSELFIPDDPVSIFAGFDPDRDYDRRRA